MDTCYTVSELAHRNDIGKLVIHSLDRSLYIATVWLPEGEKRVLDSSGVPLKTRNLESIRAILAAVPASDIVMRQRSSYDEMIGSETGSVANVMEIRLQPRTPDTAT